MENTGSRLALHTTAERLPGIANKQEEVKIIIIYAFIDVSWVPGHNRFVEGELEYLTVSH